MPLVGNYPFHFRSLLACLVFYFLNSLQGKNNVMWESHIPIGKKIYRHLESLEDKENMRRSYFSLLQENPCSNISASSLYEVDSSSEKREMEVLISDSSLELKRRKEITEDVIDILDEKEKASLARTKSLDPNDIQSMIIEGKKKKICELWDVDLPID